MKWINRFLFLIILFYSHKGFSQTYEYSFSQDLSLLEKRKDTISNIQVKNNIEQLLSNSYSAERISFILVKKNDGTSIFMPSKPIIIQSADLYTIEASTIGTFFSNDKTSEIIQSKEYLGENFFIKITPEEQGNIILTDEYSKINGYNCRKAILSNSSYLYSPNSQKKDIQIWYTDDIKVKGNVLGINRINGLIIKIDFGTSSLTLSNISSRSFKNINIKTPKNNVLISVKDFIQAIKK